MGVLIFLLCAALGFGGALIHPTIGTMAVLSIICGCMVHYLKKIIAQNDRNERRFTFIIKRIKKKEAEENGEVITETDSLPVAEKSITETDGLATAKKSVAETDNSTALVNDKEAASPKSE